LPQYKTLQTETDDTVQGPTKRVADSTVGQKVSMGVWSLKNF